jgi:antitoxin (DNA-binding transcriptional repressor) of toxin-antitoxin stability system
MRTIPATRFKAECLQRGKPVARLLPLEPPESLEGSVTFLVDDEEFIAPLFPVYEPSFP